MSFEQIKKYLHISNNDEDNGQNVEYWLVEAISYNLIDASINQIDENVTVSRYAHFQQHNGTKDWTDKQLQQLKLVQNKIINGTARMV